ncbi:MAG TPA: FtsQ-type POTRA domain-containing protein [Dissulfurispiraceae bacterium]|nr:FtsQ-type POTRA domain-containing protein [Dissulfurispiraceae bacterium]
MDSGKKKKAVTTIRRVYFVVTGLATAVVLTGGALLAYNHLCIREVNFFGNRHLTYEELLSLSGCSKQGMLFSVSVGDIYRGLKKSPWIKDAVVRKDLTGKITVQITEAVAVAVLSAGEKPYLVDRDGLRLEEIREDSSYFLPVVKIDPVSCKEAYDEAIILAGVLYDGKMSAHRGNIELSGDRPEDITMQVDNLPVKVGAGDLVRKLEKLDFVREELVRRNMTVEYIDLRFMDKIVVKPLKPEGKEISRTADNDMKKHKQKTEKKKSTAKKVTGRRAGNHVG